MLWGHTFTLCVGILLVMCARFACNFFFSLVFVLVLWVDLFVWVSISLYMCVDLSRIVENLSKSVSFVGKLCRIWENAVDLCISL